MRSAVSDRDSPGIRAEAQNVERRSLPVTEGSSNLEPSGKQGDTYVSDCRGTAGADGSLSPRSGFQSP